MTRETTDQGREPTEPSEPSGQLEPAGVPQQATEPAGEAAAPAPARQDPGSAGQGPVAVPSAPAAGEPEPEAAAEQPPAPDPAQAPEEATDERSAEAAETAEAAEPGAEETGGGTDAETEAAAEPAPPARPLDGRARLRKAVWPPRFSRGQLVVALLLFALGLGLAIQVRSTNDHNALRGARQEDLVRILDELDSRQQRLQQEKAQLDQSLTQLENSSNQAKEAQDQTAQKALELGVLAGTVRASGPGIVLTVDDPQGQVKADMLLDTLQELRAAGAEAIQINDVRVVAHTYFTDLPSGGVSIDGTKVTQPYRFTVIGNPQDLTPALNIPGGIVRTLEKEQVGANISEQQKVTVDALAVPGPTQFAKPAAK
ncbi:DUF881 domain-containing protein [Kitasatospora sp. LaBMicrA B282]|uniref:DUF881 domain-containing protein n=1 Tax=Kitasatospora sp. LaBMicrA B282 TaxID=3420949 RepID=UPI003D0D674B